MSHPARILLVEDNPMDVELTLDAFREAKLHHPLAVVGTGEAALDYMHGRGEYADRAVHPLPELILLDLKLPGISGHEVLDEIKSTPALRRLPVVVLTSSREDGDRMRTYNSGANSYLVKPVSYDGFLIVISQITEYWLRLNVAPPLDPPSSL